MNTNTGVTSNYPGLYPTVPKQEQPKPSAPAATSHTFGLKATNDDSGKKVINLTNYMEKRSKQNITHGQWEGYLWFANLFIVPLIVYPILSIVGHIMIEVCRDRYSKKYNEAKEYLSDMKCLLLSNEKGYQSSISIDEGMQKCVLDIFSKYKTDARYKKDPLMDFLTRNANNGNYVFKF